MNIIILILYHISLYLAGVQILRKFKIELPVLLFVVGSFLIGMLVGIPVTYGLACLFVKTGEPILWGVLVITVTSFGLTGYGLVKRKPATRNPSTPLRVNPQPISISISELLLIVFSLAFSTWLMFKTFHGGSGGQLFVGSNNVFDFGHSLGIVRSFSWGNTIPFTSPFEAGLPFFYHFFFYFWVAIWEHLGIPIVWAMNIPSIFSFASLLIVVYFFPQILLKQKKLAGWIAVLLTITHSTLTFWFMLINKGLSIQFIRDLWRLPTYPFAGPFDGSTISIYMTLNNYVNQRHLAFSVAAGLFIIFLYIQNKKQSGASIAFTGLLTGLLFLWNVPICILVGCILTILLCISKKRRMTGIFIGSVAAGMAVLSLQYISYIPLIIQFFSPQIVKGTEIHAQTSLWMPVSYLWQNLGILPLVALAGFFVIHKRQRTVAGVFAGLFIILCLMSVLGNRGFDQKFLSFLIIPINAIMAAAVIWLWKQKSLIVKFICIATVFILTISGFVDLLAVKNEFAYPFISKDTAPVIFWMKTHTPKESIFVSYSDMIDPVVFAGRKNYFGFFGNVGYQNRSSVVNIIYSGDIKAAKEHTISYILIPKWQKNDFPYTIDERTLRKTYTVAYEDSNFLIFRTHE